MFKKLIVSAFAAGLIAIAHGTALGQTFPDHPIKLIAPFAPGGASDVLARALADGMSKQLGQPVVVENHAGAGGTIGMGLTAAAAPDGYTIALGGNGSIVFAEGVYDLAYSAQKDLRAVGMVGIAQSAIVVNSSLGVSTLPELIEKAKAEKLTYGSPGVGSALHLAGALFSKLTGAKLVHVPYKGLVPALTDLEAGNISLVFANIANVGPFIQSGRTKAIAIIDEKPSPVLAGVPTAAEAGLPGLVMVTWYGVVAPSGVNNEVIAKLNEALAKTVKDPAFVERMGSQGIAATDDPSTGAFQALLDSEFKKWLPLIEELGIKQ